MKAILSIKETILQKAAEGHSIMCCCPRRAGKTSLVVDLLNGPLKDKDVILVTPQKTASDEVFRRGGRECRAFTDASVSLLGLEADCVIFEETYPYMTEKAKESFNRVYEHFSSTNTQVIFFFTPFPYNLIDPHPIKKLWDSTSCLKYQLEPNTEIVKAIEKDKGSFTAEYLQNEILGNWVGEI